MVQLSWASKKPGLPIPAVLKTDSLVYPAGEGYPLTAPSSRLILGDNLATMSALLPDYEGRIPLIYTDPPFFTRRQYPARVGRGEDSRRPQEWQLAEGYPDEWTDLDEYLDMLYPRLVLIHRLLAPNGTFYLHLDWHANAYARLLLDEIFGPERLLNEIVWVYHGPSPIRSAFNRKHDTILAYTKSDEYTFNVDEVRQPYNSNTVKTFASSPKAGFGKVPDLERGKVPEDWWYFPVVARLHRERTGYPTQKPEALLERILLASSNPGDLVADFFSGSGTTAVVAAQNGRGFITSDVAERAVQTARSRLVSTQSAPFMFQRAEKEGDPKPLLHQAQSLDPSLVSLRHLDNGLEVTLADELALDLDYWEVDPAWDGLVFRSARQVTRPRKKNPIPTRVQIPDLPGSRLLLVRLFYISGKQAQVLLNNVSGG